MSSNSQIILFVETRMKREFLAALPGPSSLEPRERGKSQGASENDQFITATGGRCGGWWCGQ